MKAAELQVLQVSQSALLAESTFQLCHDIMLFS
jgi:hypothetical protein